MKAFFIRSSRTVYVSSVLTWGRHMNVIRWFHCNPKSGRLSTHAQQLSHKLSILNADYCCPHLKIVKKKKKDGVERSAQLRIIRHKLAKSYTCPTCSTILRETRFVSLSMFVHFSVFVEYLFPDLGVCVHLRSLDLYGAFLR